MLDFSAWQPALLVLVFVALGLMGVGFFWRDRRANLIRAAGWTLFAFYWPFQAPEFFWPTSTEPDPINGWFTLLGPLFLLWVAWHEVKSYQWNEDPAALRWFTGASFVSALTYFILYKLPIVQNWTIRVVAEQSAWFYNTIFLAGSGSTFIHNSGGIEWNICRPNELAISSPYCPAGNDYLVTVILACTAVQSIMIFVGAIACLHADPTRKWKAYAITVPVIYILNLVRNAGIVYGTYDLDWAMFGMTSFEWMHSYVGKIGSLLAMVAIALGVFALLPELHGHILDLFDLRKRVKPGFFRPPPPPGKTEIAPAKRVES